MVGKGKESKLTILDGEAYSEFFRKHPFHDGNFMMYQRCLVNGQLFHSQNYQNVTQRNSYSVIYVSDNCNQEYSFGEVLYYGAFTDSNLGTMHSYVFVSPFQRIIKQ